VRLSALERAHDLTGAPFTSATLAENLGVLGVFLTR
jgi:hypothetical protein